MITCSVPDCQAKANCRGWCRKHYARWQRHGDPLATKRPARDMTPEERLNHHGWDVTEAGCWEWRSARFFNGYGQLVVEGRHLRAHRVAYETWVGPIPEGMVVRHKCDNAPCINPTHLEVGTQQENIDDMMTRSGHWRKRVAHDT